MCDPQVAQIGRAGPKKKTDAKKSAAARRRDATRDASDARKKHHALRRELDDKIPEGYEALFQ